LTSSVDNSCLLMRRDCQLGTGVQTGRLRDGATARVKVCSIVHLHFRRLDNSSAEGVATSARHRLDGPATMPVRPPPSLCLLPPVHPTVAESERFTGDVVSGCTSVGRDERQLMYACGKRVFLHLRSQTDIGTGEAAEILPSAGCCDHCRRVDFASPPSFLSGHLHLQLSSEGKAGAVADNSSVEHRRSATRLRRI
jgi:hypothetical protein